MTNQSQVFGGTGPETGASKPGTVIFSGFLTSLIVLHGLLLEVLKDIWPKLLF